MIKELEKNEYIKIVSLGKLLKENFSVEKIGDLEKIFVYIEDDVIYGFIQILNLYETLEIINIIVSPKQRLKGLGTRLLEFVIEKFNPEHVLLEVREKNEIARKFYYQNKFKDIRIIKNYYGDDNAIVMERSTL